MRAEIGDQDLSFLCFVATYDLYDKDGNIKGATTKMADGSVVTWRAVSYSADGSPAVDINIKKSSDSGGLKLQKIHFVKS